MGGGRFHRKALALSNCGNAGAYYASVTHMHPESTRPTHTCKLLGSECWYIIDTILAPSCTSCIYMYVSTHEGILKQNAHDAGRCPGGPKLGFKVCNHHQQPASEL